MATIRHELWVEDDGQTFCLAGPDGNDARALLGEHARLVWEVEAGSHFEAMTLYYEHMGWGSYTTEHDWDYQPYPDEWRRTQLGEERFRCPVCGELQAEEPWTDGGGGSLEICPSCGIQFGYNDAHPDHRADVHRAWRQLWIANGRRHLHPSPTFTQLMNVLGHEQQSG